MARKKKEIFGRIFFLNNDFFKNDMIQFEKYLKKQDREIAIINKKLGGERNRTDPNRIEPGRFG